MYQQEGSKSVESKHGPTQDRHKRKISVQVPWKCSRYQYNTNTHNTRKTCVMLRTKHNKESNNLASSNIWETLTMLFPTERKFRTTRPKASFGSVQLDLRNHNDCSYQWLRANRKGKVENGKGERYTYALWGEGFHTAKILRFGIRKNCRNSRRNKLLYLFIYRAIKQTVINIEAYNRYQ
jgi:hypothetical protein